MTSDDELLGAAEGAVQAALDAGADDAVAGASWGRSLDFQWRDGRLEKVQESTSRSVGVSLYVDGRYSAHSTNDLDPARMRGFVAEAVELTRALQPDPYRRIPDPALYAGRAELDLDLVDPELVNLSREERIDTLQRLEASTRAHDAVVSVTAGIYDAHGRSARASSNGFSGVMERTSVWWGSQVALREGEDKRPEAYYWVGGLHRDELPDAEQVGAEALRRAVLRLGAEKVPSRRCPMILDREAAASFVGRIFGALSAGSIQQKRSFLAGKLGEAIASPLLTLTDDPLRPRGMGSRLYDGEGIAARPMVVLAAGVLRSYYVDTYYGRKLGWAPTTGGASNIVFEHGEHDAAGLVAEVGEGIYVDSWLGGNANTTTGDFSFGLRGRLVSGGQLGAPISEMNVTGNFMDVLQRLVAVGNDPVPWSAFRSPTLVFDDVQFSGL